MCALCSAVRPDVGSWVCKCVCVCVCVCVCHICSKHSMLFYTDKHRRRHCKGLRKRHRDTHTHTHAHTHTLTARERVCVCVSVCVCVCGRERETCWWTSTLPLRAKFLHGKIEPCIARSRNSVHTVSLTY